MQIELNRLGVRELLRSSGVARDLERRARNIATRAGPGMRVDSEIGRQRARAAVITDTLEARVAEARRRALTRAVDAGRQ